jgi:hypothetical protein
VALGDELRLAIALLLAVILDRKVRKLCRWLSCCCPDGASPLNVSPLATVVFVRHQLDAVPLLPHAHQYFKSPT